MPRGTWPLPRCGCDFRSTISQESSFLATLGWRTQSRWDCPESLLPPHSGFFDDCAKVFVATSWTLLVQSVISQHVFPTRTVCQKSANHEQRKNCSRAKTVRHLAHFRRTPLPDGESLNGENRVSIERCKKSPRFCGSTAKPKQRRNFIRPSSKTRRLEASHVMEKQGLARRTR